MESRRSDSDTTMVSDDLEKSQVGPDRPSLSSTDAEEDTLANIKSASIITTFDKKAEARLRLKIDLYVLPTVALLYLFCFIDRANIGNARLAGFERDLGLTGHDYNSVLSIFYISYIICEIPANMMCKWMGPGWFIPLTTTMFGICSLATAFVHDFSQVSAVRFLLGAFEAAMLPGIAYYLSRWYRRSELAFRLSVYIVMGPLAGAFGGLLASGILNLDHVGSLHTWRMLFAVEGIITTGLGLVAFFTLTDRPATARWLTQEEKDLAIARVMSERVGVTEVLDRFDAKKTIQGLTSPVTIAMSCVFMLNNITVQGLAFFTPTIVRTIYPHSSLVSQQLHTVPPYIVGAVLVLVTGFSAWKFDRRIIFLIGSAPLMIIGYIMYIASSDPMVRYGASFLVASGSFNFGALCNAIVSANVVSDTARSSAIGMTVMFGNIGGLISTWSFLSTDGPDYHIGNGLNLATSAVCLLILIGLLLWMKRDNRRREEQAPSPSDAKAQLARMSTLEVQDLDWRHPSFRWKP